MMTFEEAVYETQSSLDELLKHFGSGNPRDIPDDLPPVVQEIWQHAQAILKAMETPEFEEIMP